MPAPTSSSGAGFEVRLLTRRPGDWSRDVESQLRSSDGELLETFHDTLTRASSDPPEVVPESDVVVLCMPVHAYRPALHAVAPHLSRDKEVFVGTVYGQASFHWMVEEVTSKYELDHVVTFAAGLLPWICRVGDYGRVGINYGCKAVNVAAMSPGDRFVELNDSFLGAVCEQWLGKGVFRQCDDFLSLTLSVDSQIIHPARCYGLFRRYGGQWPTLDDVPYFYRDFDELSAGILRDLDADYSRVRDGMRQRFEDRDFPYMLDYLALERLTYDTENQDIRESFTTSQTLGAIKPPTRQNSTGEWRLDTDHRFFTDNISYGICIAKWMAEQRDLAVPTMDAIIEWAQELRGETWIENGRLATDGESLAGRFRSGIPPVYGIETLEGTVDRTVPSRPVSTRERTRPCGVCRIEPRPGGTDVTTVEYDLNAQALMTRAQARIGRSDWGGDDFREGLDVLLRCCAEQAGLSAFGLQKLADFCVHHLANRLRVEDLIRRHPEILEEEISRPMFLVTFPRSGSSLLHRLLCQDPGIRPPYYGEMYQPAPPAGVEPSGEERRARIRQADDLFLQPLENLFPEGAAARGTMPAANEAGECYVLFENSFTSFNYTFDYHITGYLDWLCQLDFRPVYRYFKKQLQVLQWQSPGEPSGA